MANVVTTQILADGPRNTIVKIVGILDTSDIGYTTIVDPTTLSGIDGWGNKAKQVRINKITFNVEDSMTVKLYWDATVPVPIDTLVGRGTNDASVFGGLNNNSGAGKTGSIAYTTDGFIGGSQYEFTVMLEMVKQ